jgi:hypothetical protein
LLDKSGAFFVTRPKTNMRWKTLRKRPLKPCQGDGFTVKADRQVKLASKGDAKLPIFLRRITVKRETGEVFDIISNDDERSAVELAACYKARWQIELFFRWIKQNLNLKKFIACNENAIRLQILAAMIAFVLISLARQRTATLPHAAPLRRTRRCLHPHPQASRGHQQKLVFREFERLHKESSETPGLGLGLSIVDRMTKILGHKLALKSKPGAGSMFGFELPVANAADVQKPVQ